ncbi:MAG: hypothetical protein FJ278_19880, partial [Planctomycetes bacterium]|nr:hypothetical protein [Planctomycetota bacterium]
MTRRTMERQKSAASCPPIAPGRPRRMRLKLDELEPRVAPSSLLCHLPVLGAMLEALGRWSEPEEVADGSVDVASSVHLPDFSPVTPSQLDGQSADAPRRHRGHEEDIVRGESSEGETQGMPSALAMLPEDGPLGSVGVASWPEEARDADVAEISADSIPALAPEGVAQHIVLPEVSVAVDSYAGPFIVAMDAANATSEDSHSASQRSLKQNARVMAEGRTFQSDPADLFTGAETDSVPQEGPYPNSETFHLHSRSGASKVIYLDFDGYLTLAGTAWNNGNMIDSPPFDRDGQSGSFSDSEHDEMQRVWQRVAEDYAPFDVDVTTEDPAEVNLTRSDLTDDHYGIRVVISPYDDWYGGNAGGVAYIGAFPDVGDYYKPCFVFSNNLSTEAAVAHAVSHEAGHTLGLHHDGTTDGDTYYDGHGSGATSWASIMGAGSDKSVTQWSKGEYYHANNTSEDD